MENALNAAAGRLLALTAPIRPLFEKALRRILGLVYPMYAESFDYPGLAGGFALLALLLAILLVVKLIFVLAKKNNSRIPYILGSLLVLTALLIPGLSSAAEQSRKEAAYRTAEIALQQERYDAALEGFLALGGYRDSAEKADELRRLTAEPGRESSPAEPQPLPSDRDPDAPEDREKAEALANSRVSSWEEAYELILRHALARDTAFPIAYPDGPDLSADQARLTNLLSGAGMENWTVKVLDNSLEIREIRYYPHFAVCGSDREFQSCLNAWAEEKLPDFVVCFTPTYGPSLMADERAALLHILLGSRLKLPLEFTYNDSDGLYRIMVTGAAWYDSRSCARSVSVTSWDQVYTEARRAVEDGVDRLSFVFRNGPDLYEESNRLSSILRSAGIKEFQWSFWTNNVAIYDITCFESFAICSTEDEVAAYLQSCRRQKSPAVYIFCSSDALYQKLSANHSKEFFRLLEAAGCRSDTVYFYEESRMFFLEDARW